MASKKNKIKKIVVLILLNPNNTNT